MLLTTSLPALFCTGEVVAVDGGVAITLQSGFIMAIRSRAKASLKEWLTFEFRGVKAGVRSHIQTFYSAHTLMFLNSPAYGHRGNVEM